MIANTSHRESDGLVEGVPVHIGEIAAEAAEVNGITARGCTPEAGVAAESTVCAVIVASGKSRKPCGIVVGGRCAHSTSGGIAVPTHSACQRYGNVRFIIATYILALVAQVVGQLRPLRIAWHVPSRGADALYATGIGGRRGCTAHYRLPVV